MALQVTKAAGGVALEEGKKQKDISESAKLQQYGHQLCAFFGACFELALKKCTSEVVVL